MVHIHKTMYTYCMNYCASSCLPYPEDAATFRTHASTRRGMIETEATVGKRLRVIRAPSVCCPNPQTIIGDREATPSSLQCSNKHDRTNCLPHKLMRIFLPSIPQRRAHVPHAGEDAVGHDRLSAPQRPVNMRFQLAQETKLAALFIACRNVQERLLWDRGMYVCRVLSGCSGRLCGIPARGPDWDAIMMHGRA
jgi:hypothetical protein